MKKAMFVLMCATLSLTLFACGGKDNSKSSSTASDAGSSGSGAITSGTGSSGSGNPTSSAGDSGSASSKETDISALKITEMLTDICKDTNASANDVFDLDKESFEGYSFIKWTDGIEAACSEGQTSIDAHSVVLIRANNADTKAMAEEIAEKADPRKWICVGAEVGKVLYTDKYVLMVMTYERVYDGIKTNFEKLMGNDEVKVIDMKKSEKLD